MRLFSFLGQENPCKFNAFCSLRLGVAEPVEASKDAHSKFICAICLICSLLEISANSVICGLKNPLRKSAASAGERNYVPPRR